MMSHPKKTTWRGTSLKLISLALGYTFWYIFGTFHTSTAWVEVPLCFYNVPYECKVMSPETITIKICGVRSTLRSLDIEQLAIHINAQKLHPGKNLLTIDEQALFLPDSIKLVHYSPSNPIVELLPLDKAKKE